MRVKGVTGVKGVKGVEEGERKGWRRRWKTGMCKNMNGEGERIEGKILGKTRIWEDGVRVRVRASGRQKSINGE